MTQRTAIPVRLRRAVLARDAYMCRYCRDRTGPFHMDHVRPWSWGGADTVENLVTACVPCNLTKRAEQWVPLPLPDPTSAVERKETLERVASSLGHRPHWRPVSEHGAIWTCSCSRTKLHYVTDCGKLMPGITEHLVDAIAPPVEPDDSGPPMFMEWQPGRQRAAVRLK